MTGGTIGKNQMTIDRRTFVLGASGAAAAAGLATPAAADAAAATGSIMDVEHVVILMQENRAFDHYFGMLRGVRGFDDPRALTLPGGRSVWSQPQEDKAGGGVVWPFRIDTRASAANCSQGLDHSWKGSQHRWRNWDVWMPEKGPLAMAYMAREDLPYYYALADAFTVCDAYHCSIQGPTGPNRFYHMSGSSGLTAGFEDIYCVTNDGCDDNPGADMAKDDPKFGGLTWTPYAERLERAGISWRVYQEYANFSDNALGYFADFRALDRGSSRYRRGRAWVEGSTPQNAEMSRARHLIAAFAADVAADRLPAVSWIVPQIQMSEHPDASPAYGQYLTGQLIAALAANPDVWAKTVFILNYDENDGFFDHVPPPIPATAPRYGATTVDPRGETYRGEPVGLGPRVPMVIVSPWTHGGWVDSQLFDHTSVLRFLEQRFGVEEPNISPWRRSVCGDLTSAFDFDVTPQQRRDTRWLAALPDVGDYMALSDESCRAPAPVVASGPGRPRQEPGVRPARALPYALDVVPTWTETGLSLRLVNQGGVGAVFVVRDDGGVQDPRHYTVGAGRTLDAVCPIADGAYALTISGPNGFHRAYRGVGRGVRIEARANLATGGLALSLRNAGDKDVALSIRSVRSGTRRPVRLSAGAARRVVMPLAGGHRWYDVIIESGAGGAAASQRLAGHFETGAPDISEPGLDPRGVV